MSSAAPNSWSLKQKIDFSVGVLKQLGYTPNVKNVSLLVGWMPFEGTSAGYNPWATTLNEGPSSQFNSVGVKNYQSAAQGEKATADTFRGGYASVLKALQSGNLNDLSAQDINKWITGNPNKSAGYSNTKIIGNAEALQGQIAKLGIGGDLTPTSSPSAAFAQLNQTGMAKSMPNVANILASLSQGEKNVVAQAGKTVTLDKNALPAPPGPVSAGQPPKAPDPVDVLKHNAVNGVMRSHHAGANQANPMDPSSIISAAPKPQSAPANQPKINAPDFLPTRSPSPDLFGTPPGTTIQQAATAVGHAVSQLGLPGGTQSQNLAMEAALGQKGVPYLWGGTTPGKGLDCSGLVQYAWSKAGKNIPRTTYAQIAALHAVSTNPSQWQVGDLIYPEPGHVGMYIGGGRIIQAPYTGQRVQISPVSGGWAHPYAVRRP